jgi:hypothetical protein
MNAADDRVRYEIETNTPAVEVGQTWSPRFADEHRRIKRRVHVVAPYPFSEYDQREWVVEWIALVSHLERMTEYTLRWLYELDQEEPKT